MDISLLRKRGRDDKGSTALISTVPDSVTIGTLYGGGQCVVRDDASNVSKSSDRQVNRMSRINPKSSRSLRS